MAVVDLNDYEVKRATIGLCVTLASPDGVETTYNFTGVVDLNPECLRLTIQGWARLTADGHPDTPPTRASWKVIHVQDCTCDTRIVRALTPDRCRHASDRRTASAS